MRLVAVIFAMALLATACGSDSVTDVVDSATDAAGDAADAATDAVEEAMDDDEEEAMEEDEGTGGAVDEEEAADAVEEAMEEEVEDGGVVTTAIADLEALWADERAAIVADIKANGYGVDGDILTGPGGWTVDLSNCPSDWADDAGLSNGTITIGHTTPQSGALAAYGNIGFGMEAYFDYVNANGGIGPDGLQLELLIKDDAYVATQTQELVAELLQSDDPFYICLLYTSPSPRDS